MFRLRHRRNAEIRQPALIISGGGCTICGGGYTICQRALIICTALSILQDTKDMYEKADAVLNAVIMEYTVTPVRVLLFFRV